MMPGHEEVKHSPPPSHQSINARIITTIIFGEATYTCPPKVLFLQTGSVSPNRQILAPPELNHARPAGSVPDEASQTSGVGAVGSRGGHLPCVRRRGGRRIEAAAEQPRDGGDEVVLPPAGAGGVRGARERDVAVERLGGGDAVPGAADLVAPPRRRGRRPSGPCGPRAPTRCTPACTPP
jgi:hypothetical protein